MEKLRNELIKLINESKMGIDCIYYVYKDVFRDLTNEYNKVLNNMNEQQAAPVEQPKQAEENKEETNG